MLGCKSLSQTELQILDLCFMKQRTRVFFKLCLYTGLRPSEALSLRVKDVQGQDRVILLKRFSKGKVRSRSLLLHPALRVILAEHIAECGLNMEDPLFLARANKPMSYQVMLRDFKVAAARANLKGKVGLHSGRKTFASHVYGASGKDIALTARMLGHTDVNNAMSYLSFNTEATDKVVEMMAWPVAK